MQSGPPFCFANVKTSEIMAQGTKNYQKNRIFLDFRNFLTHNGQIRKPFLEETKMKSMLFSAIVLTGIVLFAPPAVAVERNVPSEYATIQAAIDASSDGDIVIVASGTYIGTGNRDIDFAGKAITVQSSDPEDPCVVAATVIDCNGSQADPHRGFHFHTGEGTSSVLDGLTIKRGYVYDSNGGGIYCEIASPIIKNCVIANNTAYGRAGTSSVPDGGQAYGGGAFCSSGSSAMFLNCTIANNVANGGFGYGLYYLYKCGTGGKGYGGGISCASNSSVSIINCTISSNQACGNIGEPGFSGSNGYGGGISCTSYSNAIISNSIITVNTATGGAGHDGSLDTYDTNAGNAYGGGIYFDTNSQPTIKDCNILGNSASGGTGGAGDYTNGGSGGYAYGGGIWGSSASRIQNCLITGNSACGGAGGTARNANRGGTGGDGQGAGIYLPASTGIQNCLITNNSASGGNGGNIVDTGYGGNGGNGKGAGIYCLSNAPIKNSTVVNNTASRGIHGSSYFTPAGVDGNGFGGGLYCENSPGIIDTILWGNADSGGTTKSAQIYGGTPAVSYSCTQGGAFTGTGNISTDPCFVSVPQGNYYLSQIVAGQPTNSPCVDTGSNYAAMIGFWNSSTRTDLIPDSSIVDMGYHRGSYDSNSPGNINNDCVVNFVDFAILASQWNQAPGTPSADIAPPGDGIVDWNDFVLMAQSWLWVCTY